MINLYVKLFKAGIIKTLEEIPITFRERVRQILESEEE